MEAAQDRGLRDVCIHQGWAHIVQVMEGEPQTQAAGPQQYSQGGYEASYGTYKVDESTHTFTFHVEGALVRSLIGKDLPRAYEFFGQAAHREVYASG